MRKLKLDLESLNVDTFSTGTGKGGDGTVQGNLYEKPTTSLNDQMTCGQQTCNGGASCYTCSICMTFDQMCQQQDELDFA